jgi:hypothetical protein
VPLHQFEQSPIVIEVKDRNPSPDDMVSRRGRLAPTRVAARERDRGGLPTARPRAPAGCGDNAPRAYPSSPPPFSPAPACPPARPLTRTHALSSQVYIGPNVVAGYTHPETGKIVKDQAEHAQVMAQMASVDAGSHAPV